MTIPPIRKKCLLAISLLASTLAQAEITIPTVVVGDPGNPADPTTGFGSVSYTYHGSTISRFYEARSGEKKFFRAGPEE
jgi:hypothetical protein